MTVSHCVINIPDGVDLGIEEPPKSPLLPRSEGLQSILKKYGEDVEDNIKDPSRRVKFSALNVKPYTASLEYGPYRQPDEVGGKYRKRWRAILTMRNLKLQEMERKRLLSEGDALRSAKKSQEDDVIEDALRSSKKSSQEDDITKDALGSPKKSQEDDVTEDTLRSPKKCSQEDDVTEEIKPEQDRNLKQNVQGSRKEKEEKEPNQSLERQRPPSPLADLLQRSYSATSHEPSSISGQRKKKRIRYRRVTINSPGQLEHYFGSFKIQVQHKAEVAFEDESAKYKTRKVKVAKAIASVVSKPSLKSKESFLGQEVGAGAKESTNGPEESGDASVVVEIAKKVPQAHADEVKSSDKSVTLSSSKATPALVSKTETSVSLPMDTDNTSSPIPLVEISVDNSKSATVSIDCQAPLIGELKSVSIQRDIVSEIKIILPKEQSKKSNLYQQTVDTYVKKKENVIPKSDGASDTCRSKSLQGSLQTSQGGKLSIAVLQQTSEDLQMEIVEPLQIEVTEPSWPALKQQPEQSLVKTSDCKKLSTQVPVVVITDRAKCNPLLVQPIFEVKIEEKSKAEIVVVGIADETPKTMTAVMMDTSASIRQPSPTVANTQPKTIPMRQKSDVIVVNATVAENGNIDINDNDINKLTEDKYKVCSAGKKEMNLINDIENTDVQIIVGDNGKERNEKPPHFEFHTNSTSCDISEEIVRKPEKPFVNAPKEGLVPEDVSRHLDVFKTSKTGLLAFQRPVTDERNNAPLLAGPMQQDILPKSGEISAKYTQLTQVSDEGKGQESLQNDISRSFDKMKIYTSDDIVLPSPVVLKSPLGTCGGAESQTSAFLDVSVQEAGPENNPSSKGDVRRVQHPRHRDDTCNVDKPGDTRPVTPHQGNTFGNVLRHVDPRPVQLHDQGDINGSSHNLDDTRTVQLHIGDSIGSARKLADTRPVHHQMDINGNANKLADTRPVQLHIGDTAGSARKLTDTRPASVHQRDTTGSALKHVDTKPVQLHPMDLCRTPVQISEPCYWPEEISRNLDVLKTFASGKPVLIRPVTIRSCDDETEEISLKAGPIPEHLQRKIKCRSFRNPLPQMPLPEEVSRNLDILKTFLSGKIVLKRSITVQNDKCGDVFRGNDQVLSGAKTTVTETTTKCGSSSNDSVETTNMSKQHMLPRKAVSTNLDVLKAEESAPNMAVARYKDLTKKSVERPEIPAAAKKGQPEQVKKSTDLTTLLKKSFAHLKRVKSKPCSDCEKINLRSEQVDESRIGVLHNESEKTSSQRKLCRECERKKRLRAYIDAQLREIVEIKMTGKYTRTDQKVEASRVVNEGMSSDKETVEDKTAKPAERKRQTEQLHKNAGQKTGKEKRKVYLKPLPSKPCSDCEKINLRVTSKQISDSNNELLRKKQENSSTETQLCRECQRKKRLRVYIDEQLKEIVEIKMTRKYTRTNVKVASSRMADLHKSSEEKAVTDKTEQPAGSADEVSQVLISSKASVAKSESSAMNIDNKDEPELENSASKISADRDNNNMKQFNEHVSQPLPDLNVVSDDIKKSENVQISDVPDSNHQSETKDEPASLKLLECTKIDSAAVKATENNAVCLLDGIYEPKQQKFSSVSEIIVNSPQKDNKVPTVNKVPSCGLVQDSTARGFADSNSVAELEIEQFQLIKMGPSLHTVPISESKLACRNDDTSTRSETSQVSPLSFHGSLETVAHRNPTLASKDKKESQSVRELVKNVEDGVRRRHQRPKPTSCVRRRCIELDDSKRQKNFSAEKETSYRVSFPVLTVSPFGSEGDSKMYDVDLTSTTTDDKCYDSAAGKSSNDEKRSLDQENTISRQKIADTGEVVMDFLGKVKKVSRLPRIFSDLVYGENDKCPQSEVNEEPNKDDTVVPIKTTEVLSENQGSQSPAKAPSCQLRRRHNRKCTFANDDELHRKKELPPRVVRAMPTTTAVCQSEPRQSDGTVLTDKIHRLADRKSDHIKTVTDSRKEATDQQQVDSRISPQNNSCRGKLYIYLQNTFTVTDNLKDDVTEDGPGTVTEIKEEPAVNETDHVTKISATVVSKRVEVMEVHRHESYETVETESDMAEQPHADTIHLIRNLTDAVTAMTTESYVTPQLPAPLQSMELMPRREMPVSRYAVHFPLYAFISSMIRALSRRQRDGLSLRQISFEYRDQRFRRRLIIQCRPFLDDHVHEINAVCLTTPTGRHFTFLTTGSVCTVIAVTREHLQIASNPVRRRRLLGPTDRIISVDVCAQVNTLRESINIVHGQFALPWCRGPLRVHSVVRGASHQLSQGMNCAVTLPKTNYRPERFSACAIRGRFDINNIRTQLTCKVMQRTNTETLTTKRDNFIRHLRNLSDFYARLCQRNHLQSNLIDQNAPGLVERQVRDHRNFLKHDGEEEKQRQQIVYEINDEKKGQEQIQCDEICTADEDGLYTVKDCSSNMSTSPERSDKQKNIEANKQCPSEHRHTVKTCYNVCRRLLILSCLTLPLIFNLHVNLNANDFHIGLELSEFAKELMNIIAFGANPLTLPYFEVVRFGVRHFQRPPL